jgi:DNA-binding transcriptional regulator LsrR (DeoR family)
MALFAETLVRVRDFARLTRQVGVKEAFKAKKDIRIIVTGLGDARDEHDLLTIFLRESGKDIRKTGAIGNVQYRPFTRDGALRESPDDLRAVTLFELDELVELCKRKDHHVILIARQCGRGMIRSDVVRVLLERESLRVFSHLVMELPTAEALVMSAGS